MVCESCVRAVAYTELGYKCHTLHLQYGNTGEDNVLRMFRLFAYFITCFIIALFVSTEILSPLLMTALSDKHTNEWAAAYKCINIYLLMNEQLHAKVPEKTLYINTFC